MASTSPARRAASDAAHHGHEHQAVVVNGVSSDDEPSVEWGWHGHYPKVANFAGFLVAAICLVMIWGNHVGQQENIWLVVIAVAFFALSLGSIIRARTSWRR
ncbi:DUF2631 domain-containing protein [Actinomycetospora termitidis]|uniref:DUF2631 domain-containing protein n=1 Tax=Actinomycetospora termitidis TaxID=3053470 RepID=A0ABT7M5Q8_9PSEU|nr:DUF2631 domain-containing protein [Actinomycetospora sp. Odt1-22]MDL5156000.1 DUF2631 domain-containing protein [Actinomycetospora sp. Odt1-22]